MKNYGAIEVTPPNLRKAHRLVLSSVNQPSGEAETSRNPQRIATLLKDIIDVMDIAFWELDTNYKIVSLNRKAEELYGKNCVGMLCYRAAAKRDSVCPECPAKMVYDGAASGRSGAEFECPAADGHVGDSRFADVAGAIGRSSENAAASPGSA